MEKEFVPYEQALALKELGFNEPCFGMYQKNKRILHCDKNDWITNFEVNPNVGTLNLHIREYPKNVSLINGTYFLHSCSNFTAPTFSQAFRWFREEHKIYVKYIKNELESHIFSYKHSENAYKLASKRNNYEEAELECLKKLIEIVKEK